MTPEDSDIRKPVRIAWKIVMAYILLSGILLGGVWFIMQVTERLTSPNNLSEETARKRQAMNDLTGDLYQMEIVGGTVARGHEESLPRYKEALRKVKRDIQTLRSLLDAQPQQERLDSLSRLVAQKDYKLRHIVTVSKQQKDNNKNFLEELKKVINQQDTIQPEKHVKRSVVVQTRITQRVDTVKKSFWKKLGSLFHKSKPDTAKVITEQSQVQVDTVVNPYSAGDTVVHILKGVRNQLLQSHAQNIMELSDKSRQLQLDGLEISHKLTAIFKSIEQEETAQAAFRNAQARELRLKSVRTLSRVALGAVGLSALFMLIIGRELFLESRYRKEIEEARRKAYSLMRSRERLMLTITHDIKAPAGSVLGYSDLLLRLVKDERQKLYVENLRSSAKHLLDLVGSLLDYHRLEANKMDINQIAFNPSKLFDEIYHSFLPLAEKKGLTLQYESTATTHVTLSGDPFRIRQIAENFLSNALKFTQEGGVRLLCDYRNGHLRFSVTDTGQGISEEDKGKIFQEFTRLSNAQGEEGFGLGLAITLKLTQLLGGDIDVTSEQGKGSCFTVVLPVTEVQEATPKDAPQAESQVPTLPERHLNVLMIDDDQIQLDLTKALLEQMGIRAVCCQYPEDLLDFLYNGTYDVLFTDIQMPAMDGFKLVRYLRNSSVEQARRIPVVALTARDDIDSENLRERGFAGCLHKPFSKTDVSRLLESLSLSTPSILSDTAEESGHDCPQKEGLDFSALKDFCGGDEDALKEILESFLQESSANIARLEEASKEKDIAKAAATAHKMLPLFRMLKASESATLLEKLERERDTKEWPDNAERTISDTVQAVSQTLKETAEYLNQRDV